MLRLISYHLVPSLKNIEKIKSAYFGYKLAQKDYNKVLEIFNFFYHRLGIWSEPIPSRFLELFVKPPIINIFLFGKVVHYQWPNWHMVADWPIIFIMNCFGHCSYWCWVHVKTNTSCNYLVVVITKDAGYLFSWKFENFLWVSLPTKERQNVGLRAMFCLYLVWLWKCCHLLLHTSFVIWPHYSQHLFIH